MEPERRAHPRKLVSTGVAFHDADGAPLRGWLHDISRGGCFVATPSLSTFGEELAFDLTLPYPRQRVHGKARVVWVRETNDKDLPAGMGMQFVEVNEDAFAAIDKLAAGAKLSRPKTVIGLAPPAPGSSPSYSDVRIPLPSPTKTETETETETETGTETETETGTGTAAVADPVDVGGAAVEAGAAKVLESPLQPPPEPPPKRLGREKWLIAGAAAISVIGLVALGIGVARHGSASETLDAAPSASASAVETAAATETETASTAPVVAPPPIVDASTHDASTHDAGKKKPRRKKIRRR